MHGCLKQSPAAMVWTLVSAMQDDCAHRSTVILIWIFYRIYANDCKIYIYAELLI